MSLLRVAIVGLLLSLTGAAQAKPTGVSVQVIKQMALKYCLQDNYQRANPDGARAVLDDRSFLVESYALDNARRYETFHAWVATETKNFHQLTMSLKDEGGRANNVLAQCLHFYQSDKLDHYIRGQMIN